MVPGSAQPCPLLRTLSVSKSLKASLMTLNILSMLMIHPFQTSPLNSNCAHNISSWVSNGRPQLNMSKPKFPKSFLDSPQITFPAQGGAAWHFQVPGLVSAPSLIPTKGSGNLCLPYPWNTSRIDHFLPPSHHHLHPKTVCPSSLLPTSSCSLSQNFQHRIQSDIVKVWIGSWHVFGHTPCHSLRAKVKVLSMALWTINTNWHLPWALAICLHKD